MLVGSVQSAIIFIFTVETNRWEIMEESGASTDHWILGMSMFTSLMFVVNNKFMCYTHKFNYITLISVFGTSYAAYFLYIWLTDDLKDLVRQHYTFYRMATSLKFHATWFLPTSLCLFLDLMLKSSQYLLRPNPQRYLKQFLC